MRRKSPFVVLLTVVWVLFLAWVAWGFVAVRTIDQPPYAVLLQADGYEVREYPAHVAAQVSLKSGWQESLDEGLRVLAAYMHGDNISQKSIADAQSVGIESEPDSELIALTAPVVTQEKNDAYLISLVMPASFTSLTLPRPNNPVVRIVDVPSAVVAVRSFSGRVDKERAGREEQILRELLGRDKRVTVSAARLVQFNPPWSPPFLRRSEVLIPIRRGEFQ